MARAILVTAFGLLAGALIGVSGLVAFAAACVWDGRMDWSDVGVRYAPHLVVIGSIGAVNGLVGAWDGWLSGARRPGPVLVVPLLLLTWPAVTFLRHPSDSKSWGVEGFVAVFIGLFVWVAGRVTQEIGAATKARRCGGGGEW